MRPLPRLVPRHRAVLARTPLVVVQLVHLYDLRSLAIHSGSLTVLTVPERDLDSGRELAPEAFAVGPAIP